MCSALLHALNTRSRGAAKWREITSGSGVNDALSDFISNVRAITSSFFVLEGFEIIAQPIEPVLPLGPAGIDPLFDEAQRPRLDAARPDAADLFRHDEPGALEHGEMLHHRRKRHREGFGEVAHRSRAAGK